VRELTSLPALPGGEGQLCDKIVEIMTGTGRECKRDGLGGIFCDGEGKTALCASLDEQGFIVTSVFDSGKIFFSPLGSPDVRRSISAKVVSNKGEKGFLFTDKDSGDILAADCYIEYANPADVSVGDLFTFERSFTEHGENSYIGAGLSARAGCAVLLSLALSGCKAPLSFFTRGNVRARAASSTLYSLDVDSAIFIISEKIDDKTKLESDSLGIILADGGCAADSVLAGELSAAAKSVGINASGVVIPAQTGLSSSVAAGLRTGGILIPCKNIGSPAEAIDGRAVEGAVLIANGKFKGGEQSAESRGTVDSAKFKVHS
jgi:putative aminopeptidase FrvX